jgi:gamma-glutamylcyclotransferase (GGCT)/AIG2-like uncharacterized protein YtfP
MSGNEPEALAPFEDLFVYGSLRSSQTNPFARLLAESADCLGPAKVRGRLYRIGSYPGLIPSKSVDEWVLGEVFRMRNPAVSLAALDDYEGCGARDTPPFPYERVATHAALEDGQILLCWVYVYRGSQPLTEERRIRSGDFLAG